MYRSPKRVADLGIKMGILNSLDNFMLARSRGMDIENIPSCATVATAMHPLLTTITCGSFMSVSPTRCLIWELRNSEVQAWVIGDIKGRILDEYVEQIEEGFGGDTGIIRTLLDDHLSPLRGG